MSPKISPYQFQSKKQYSFFSSTFKKYLMNGYACYSNLNLSIYVCITTTKSKHFNSIIELTTKTNTCTCKILKQTITVQLLLAVRSAIFWQKSPHKFSDTDLSNLIIASIDTLDSFFLYRN